MPIQTLNTIKKWFKTGLKPTQEQFWDTWDSFRHKNENVPIQDIENLETVLDAKAEKSELDNHTTNANAHNELFATKEDKTSKGIANGYVPLDEFSKITAQYLAIVNDLVTDSKTSLLSAQQGVVLKKQIDEIKNLLASDNANLNTIQKIVNYIEEIQLSLNSILINDLTTGGITKALTAEMGKLLQNNKVDKVPGKSLIADSEITRLASLSSTAIATDAETQISTAVIEDNKVVSRSKLFNWWNWIKTQTQSINSFWEFKNGLKSTGSFDMGITRPLKASTGGWFQSKYIEASLQSYFGAVGNVQGFLFNTYQDIDDQKVFRQISNGNQFTLGAGKFDFQGNGQKFIWSFSPVYVQGQGKDEVIPFLEMMTLQNTGRLNLEGGSNSGLSINADNVSEPFSISMYSNDIDKSGYIIGKRYSGSKANPEAVKANSNLVAMYGAGYDGVNSSFRLGGIKITAKENFTTTSKPTHIDFCTTLIGNISYSTRMRLDHNGDLLIGNTTNNSLGKLQVDGNIYTKGLLIPSANLVTVPVNGLIERDENGQLWETHNGVRSRLITASDDLILLAYKSPNTIQTNIAGAVSAIATNTSSSTIIGKIGNNSFLRLNALNEIYYPSENKGTVPPMIAKTEVFLKINNGLFASYYKGSDPVNQVKIMEFSGLNNNGFKNYQNPIVTNIQNQDPLIAQWSTIQLVVQTINNGTTTNADATYYLRDADNTRTFGANEASFSFVFVNTVVFADATNEEKLNTERTIRVNNYALYLETIR
ncbi:MAG: hypothetical protein REI96_06900 [Flavobacterium nitrogenifigens]|uniref:hypothetical protein n=1 Tax=Flavobacterium nitrogenifigens TaxID=1617283 RepID=UPI002808AA3D|nr:hypothetical protein [Flavobacterium nitrogenifigens]MDQ8012156.1 hypothetical protein [Flavobacterium nitrogenifigens]